MVLGNIGESSISLADLRSRRVPVEWFEAVAIIQQLARVLLESDGVPNVSITPQDIVIDAAGNVRFTANAAGGSETVVRRVGELLQMSLADSRFPVPLRLVILQSIATPPSYASLAELASALEYFERPDRTGLIRAVYERAQTYQPVADGVAQSVQQTDHENAALPPKNKRRRVSTLTIAASVAALTVIAIAVAVSQVVTWPQGSAPVVEQAETDVSGQAEAEADASPRPRLAEDGGVTARVVARPHNETDVVTRSDSAREPSSTSTPTTIDASDLTGMEPVEASDATVATTADTTIYSASDDDVAPPVATYPRLPARPSAGVRVEDQSTIELLVGETGLVESVKFLGRPTDLGEALLVTLNLSAAKTWRFRPAVKDGRPVRYRTSVQVWPTTR